MKNVVIEVGTNQGTDTLKLLKEYDSVISDLYTFEPTHELLYNKLWKVFEMPHLSKIKIMPLAIHDEPSFLKFYVAGVNLWGSSSIYEFRDDISLGYDCTTTHSYTVPAIRLDDFIRMYKIDSIEYLWVDTQGNDFHVLNSLGDEIHKVKKGKCESAYNQNDYKNDESNDYRNIIAFLESKGFKAEVRPTNKNSEEADVHFYRINT